MNCGEAHVTCIVPTLNESPTIAAVVHAARATEDTVVIVDGGSTDGTVEWAQRQGIPLITERRVGKGWALRTAFAVIPADIYVTIDGDATYDAMEMPRLLTPLLAGEADMVVGSRFKGRCEDGAISRLNTIGNLVFNWLIHAATGRALTDTQSGFRAITRSALQRLTLTAEGFEIETEITLQAVQHGLRILEIPITYRRRNGSSSKLRVVADGLRIINAIFRA